jgi:hypothetical protein
MAKKSCGVVLALAFLAGLPSLAHAQGLELNPYGGLFVPAVDLAEVDLDTYKQATAVAVGGRVTFWLPASLGIEGAFNYALSDVEVTTGGVTTSDDAWVWQASARALLSFGAPGLAFHVGGGIAWIDREGDADETQDVGGVADVGLRIGLPVGFKIRVDVEDYIYEFKPAGAEGALQHDFVISGGIAFGL